VVSLTQHRGNTQAPEARFTLAAIVDSSDDAIISKDLRGNITSWNKAAEAMLGYTEEAILHRPITLIIPASRLGEEDEIMRCVLRGQKISHFETERVGRDGQSVFVMLSVSPIRDGNGAVVGVSKILRDLTEGRERDRRITQLQAELVHVSRINDLGQIVSALAHEVNQPLTAVSAYISGIRRLLARVNQPAIAQAIELVAQQNSRAWQILERIRDRVNKREMQTQVEDLAATIAQAAELALIADHRAPMPEISCGADATVAIIDKIQIQQVLTNLIRNAAEAVVDVAVPRLVISTAAVGDMIEISVADNGPGLPEAVRHRLFQPFVTTKASGMGVGLSVCFAIIAAHGGNFRFEDGPEGGAVFHFTVPRSGPVSALATAAHAFAS